MDLEPTAAAGNSSSSSTLIPIECQQQQSQHHRMCRCHVCSNDSTRQPGQAGLMASATNRPRAARGSTHQVLSKSGTIIVFYLLWSPSFFSNNNIMIWDIVKRIMQDPLCATHNIKIKYNIKIKFQTKYSLKVPLKILRELWYDFLFSNDRFHISKDINIFKGDLGTFCNKKHNVHRFTFYLPHFEDFRWLP